MFKQALPNFQFNSIEIFRFSNPRSIFFRKSWFSACCKEVRREKIIQCRLYQVYIEKAWSINLEVKCLFFELNWFELSFLSPLEHLENVVAIGWLVIKSKFGRGEYSMHTPEFVMRFLLCSNLILTCSIIIMLSTKVRWINKI